jgi:hypothetical protein
VVTAVVRMAAMAVVRMAVNWLGVHVLHRNGREGHDVHSLIADGWSRIGFHAFNRNQVGMINGLNFLEPNAKRVGRGDR